VDSVIATGAALMLRDRWRITRAVYPFLPAVWPCGKTPQAALADARKGMRHERRLAIDHPHLHDTNRMIALRQAERALVRIVAQEAVAEAMASLQHGQG